MYVLQHANLSQSMLQIYMRVYVFYKKFIQHYPLNQAPKALKITMKLFLKVWPTQREHTLDLLLKIWNLVCVKV